MDAIDQLATALSLGVTTIAAFAVFGWQLYGLRVMHKPPQECARTFFRTTVTVGVVAGTLVLAFLDWLVGELQWRPYHSHGAYIVWFFAFIANLMLGALLASAGRSILEHAMPPNSTPHTDARDASESASVSGARAGGRER